MPDWNFLLKRSHLYKVTINEILEPNQDFVITEMEDIHKRIVEADNAECNQKLL